MSNLCWKCLEKLSYPVDRVTLDLLEQLLHCHHEPKEKCWCEINNSYQYRTNIGNVLVQAKFCPECGRKL